MTELVVAILAGALVLDVLLDCWRSFEAVERRRQRDRNRADMLRALDRTGGRRP